MKILMYADGFGVPTQTFITQDVRHLSKNHDIVFVCTAKNNDLSIPNVEIKHIPIQQTLLQKILWKLDISCSFKNACLKKELQKIIDQFKPDVIHGQFGIESLRLIDNLEHTNIPVAIQFRGYDASKLLGKKAYVKRLQEIMSIKNHYSIFVANSLRKNLNAHDINTHNHMILHSGIDLNKFKVQSVNSKNNKHFIFLQISSLNEKKGHIYTLKAFAIFLKESKLKNYILKLTGDGKRKVELEELALHLGIQDHVAFVGFVNYTEAKILLQEADVFVHHSITSDDGDEEGIPNAIMEAMAMQLPILSTYHAGIPELVTHGVNGYLVKEKDIATYTERMHDISKWGKLEINRKVIEDKFEISYHVKKLEVFYMSMLQPSN